MSENKTLRKIIKEEVFNGEERSLKDFDLTEFVYSTFGDYVGESIQEILLGDEKKKGKLTECKENGYCLWSIGSGPIVNMVRDRCEKRKESYVLLPFTGSKEQANSDVNIYQYVYIGKKINRKKQNIGAVETIREMGFIDDEINKYRLLIPSTTFCSGSRESAKAFVVDEIYLLDCGINKAYLENFFYRLDGEKGDQKSFQKEKKFNQRTDYLTLKEKTDLDYEKLAEKPNDNNICLIAKLKEPYCIFIDSK